jgi:predicted nucleic acid-binding protein
VKLVVDEPESDVLRRFLRRRRPMVSSALARTEVLRALFDDGEIALARGRAMLLAVDLIRLSDRVLTSAASLLPPSVRSLDAIHIATARLLGDELGYLVSYDERLIEAATSLGLRTASPE